jgi:hypothetical protein
MLYRAAVILTLRIMELKKRYDTKGVCYEGVSKRNYGIYPQRVGFVDYWPAYIVLHWMEQTTGRPLSAHDNQQEN